MKDKSDWDDFFSGRNLERTSFSTAESFERSLERIANVKRRNRKRVNSTHNSRESERVKYILETEREIYINCSSSFIC